MNKTDGSCSYSTGANILITEDGRLQLCDFGIAGVLTSDHDKRSTLIGTPNWMPKELIAAMIGMAGETKYSTDIDWWAFGCVMYEMATGMPPYGAVHPTQILQMGLPRLEGGKYSQGLRDIVAFCLPESAEDRPSGDKVMQHHYIASTNERYPTSSLSQLLERFALWEQAGGYRQSLFTAYGAQGPILNEEDSADEDDEWNFSTSNEFERRLSQANINRLSDPFHDEALSPRSDNSKTPTALVAPNQEKSKFQQRMEDMAVQRGGKQLEKIFNLQGSEYEYGAAPESGRRMSDLPLRNLEGDTSTGDRTTVIDLDMADFAPPSIDLGQATLKPNRRTQWYGNFDDEEPEYPPYEDPNQTTRRATRDWKMPLMPAPADNPNRRTQDWTFPKMDASDSSANESNGSESLRKRRRPAAGTLKLPPLDAAENPNRRTQDWTFPKAETYMPENAGARVNEASEAFKAQNNSRMNEFNFGGFPAPDSPNRGSIIDLDLALDVPSNLERTFSATSATGSAFTDITTGNPFDLEDQVEMTKSNNRASMHMKSQSEPAARYTNDEADDRAYGSDGDSQVTTDRTGLPRASSARDLNGQFQRQSPSSLQRKWTSHQNNASQDFPFDTGDSSAPESASSSSPTSNTFEGFDSTIIVENEELPKPPANLALLIEQVRKPPLPPDAFIMSNEADEEKMTAELRRLATDLTKTLDVFITRYAVEGEGPVKRI